MKRRNNILLNVYQNKLLEFAFISDPNGELREIKDSLSTQKSKASSKGAITRKFNQQFKSLAPSVRKKMASLSPQEADVYRMKLYSILNSTADKEKVKEAIKRLNKPSRRKPPVYQKQLPLYTSAPRDKGIGAIFDQPLVDKFKVDQIPEDAPPVARRTLVQMIGDKAKGDFLVYQRTKKSVKDAVARALGLDSIIGRATGSKDAIIKALKDRDLDKLQKLVTNTLNLTKEEATKVIAQAKLYIATAEKIAKTTKTTRRGLLGLPEPRPKAIDIPSRTITDSFDIWDEPLPPSSRLPQPKPKPKPILALPPARSPRLEDLFTKRSQMKGLRGELVPASSMRADTSSPMNTSRPTKASFLSTKRSKLMLAAGLTTGLGLSGYAGYKQYERNKRDRKRKFVKNILEKNSININNFRELDKEQRKELLSNYLTDKQKQKLYG